MEVTFTGGSTIDWSTVGITTTTTTDNVWSTGFMHVDPYPEPWGGSWNPPEKKNNWEEIRKILEENEIAQKKKEDKLMRVYEVIVVDAKECEVLKHETAVIAKDTETAMLDMDLTPEVRKKVKKGDVKFIFNELGNFEKVERQIRVKELVEEDE